MNKNLTQVPSYPEFTQRVEIAQREENSALADCYCIRSLRWLGEKIVAVLIFKSVSAECTISVAAPIHCGNTCRSGLTWSEINRTKIPFTNRKAFIGHYNIVDFIDLVWTCTRYSPMPRTSATLACHDWIPSHDLFTVSYEWAPLPSAAHLFSRTCSLTI